MSEQKKKKKDKVEKALDMSSGLVSFCAVMLALVLILYSGYVLYDSMAIEMSAFSANSDLLKYKPSVMGQPSGEESLADINPDYRGWIDVGGDSPIDYPVVQGKNDLYYASHDAYGEISLTGAIYMAAENKEDLSDNYIILYGHHMDNSAMFGSLDKFKDSSYFSSHKTATFVAKDDTVYDVTFFALVSTDAYENQIYKAGNRMKDALDFLKGSRDEDAGIGTKVLVSDWDATKGMQKMIALSTCASADTNGRLVLFGVVKENEEETKNRSNTAKTTPSPTPEKTVKLTVKYYKGSEKVFPDEVFVHVAGDDYYVVSPQLAGYDADILIVKGTIQDDMTVIVRYTPKEWTLKIKYIFLDGKEAAKPYTATVKTGEEYSVDSPKIEDFKAQKLKISGTNPGRNEEYTVIYLPEYMRDDPPPPPLGLDETFMQIGICFE